MAVVSSLFDITEFFEERIICLSFDKFHQIPGSDRHCSVFGDGGLDEDAGFF